MSLNPRRHRFHRDQGDHAAAFAGGMPADSRPGDDDSARAIHETRVQMLARMAEALEGKTATAREALAQAANRVEQG